MKKIFILLLLFICTINAKVTTAYAPEATKKEIYNLELEQWLDKLSFCESGGNPNAINPDDGGSRSVGHFQWKDASFSAYSKKYNLEGSIENPQDQRELVKLVIKNEYGWRNWYNCTKKIGLPPTE